MLEKTDEGRAMAGNGRNGGGDLKTDLKKVSERIQDIPR